MTRNTSYQVGLPVVDNWQREWPSENEFCNAVLCSVHFDNIFLGWQLVVLPANEDNHPVLRKSSADSIPLEHVARLFPVLG